MIKYIKKVFSQNLLTAQNADVEIVYASSFPRQIYDKTNSVGNRRFVYNEIYVRQVSRCNRLIAKHVNQARVHLRDGEHYLPGCNICTDKCKLESR